MRQRVSIGQQRHRLWSAAPPEAPSTPPMVEYGTNVVAGSPRRKAGGRRRAVSTPRRGGEAPANVSIIYVPASRAGRDLRAIDNASSWSLHTEGVRQRMVPVYNTLEKRRALIGPTVPGVTRLAGKVASCRFIHHRQVRSRLRWARDLRGRQRADEPGWDTPGRHRGDDIGLGRRCLALPDDRHRCDRDEARSRHDERTRGIHQGPCAEPCRVLAVQTAPPASGWSRRRLFGGAGTAAEKVKALEAAGV